MNKNNLNTIRCVSCDRRGDKIGRKNINRIGTKSVIRKVKMIQKNVKLGDFICKKCQSSAKEYDKNNEKEFNNNDNFDKNNYDCDTNEYNGDESDMEVTKTESMIT
jgi:hypothetical protein